MTSRDTWNRVRAIPRLLSGYMDRLPNAVRPSSASRNDRRVRARVMEVTVHHDHRVLQGVNGMQVMIATGSSTAIIKARDVVEPRREYTIRTVERGIIETLQPGDEIEVGLEHVVQETFHGFRP